MFIGQSGRTGVINFSGGTINKGPPPAICRGNTGSTGYVNQTAGTLNDEGEFWIGQEATANGRYDLSGSGVVVVTNWVAIGRAGGTGLEYVWWIVHENRCGGNHITIGSGGPGTINQTGGTITSVLSDTWIGESASAIWNLNGGSAILSVRSHQSKQRCIGTLNLNGGSMSATEVTTGNAAA